MQPYNLTFLKWYILPSEFSVTSVVTIALCILSSFLISILLIPEIIKVAHAYNVLDTPDFERKIHRYKVPSFGGLAIFTGCIVSTLVWAISFHINNIQYLLGALFVILIVGFRDDLIPLRASIKLLGQFIAATMIIYFGDIRFESLHGFLGITEVNLVLSYTITLFTIIVITNAFNLIDGINGLAGTVALIVFGFYGGWFYLHANYSMTIVCFSLIGAVTGFLMYNYNSQIFMGDTGSLLIGFLASATTIIFINENSLQNSSMFQFSNPITVASSVLVYPLFDTLRVFMIRISQKRSPFSADRNHIHHLFLNLGFSHLQATFSICVFNLLFLGLACYADGFLNDNLLVPILVTSMSGLVFILKKVIYWRSFSFRRKVFALAREKKY